MSGAINKLQIALANDLITADLIRTVPSDTHDALVDVLGPSVAEALADNPDVQTQIDDGVTAAVAGQGFLTAVNDSGSDISGFIDQQGNLGVTSLKGVHLHPDTAPLLAADVNPPLLALNGVTKYDLASQYGDVWTDAAGNVIRRVDSSVLSVYYPGLILPDASVKPSTLSSDTLALLSPPLLIPTIQAGDLYVMNDVTGVRTKITTGLTITGTPRITGGGQYVLFDTTQRGLCWAPVGGGTVNTAGPSTTTLAYWGTSHVAANAPLIAPLLTSHGVTTYNGGQAGTLSAHIFSRFGSRPALSSGSTVIPTSGTVNLAFSNVNLTLFNAYTIVGYFEGYSQYPGTAVKAGGGGAAPLVFTPSAYPSSPVTVPSGTKFISQPGLDNRNSIVILWAGANDLTPINGGPVGPTELMNRYLAAYNYLTSLGHYVLVIGEWLNGTSTAANIAPAATLDPGDPGPRNDIATWNAMCLAQFGNRFFDVQAFVLDPTIFTQLGITPTSLDLTEQGTGNLAPSLSGDYAYGGHIAQHLSAAAGTLLAQKITAKLISLGYVI